MAVYGIVAEYNPFHNGHLYQINEIKKNDPEAEIVVAMSPNVVQRGDFALFDKWTRAKAALLSGADLVLEIPSPFAVATAEKFALGAVKTLDTLGCVDYLCFGSESGSIDNIMAAAKLEQSEKVNLEIKEQLSKGVTYAKARSLAIEKTNKAAAESLNTPNDILGVEYLKAISKIGSEIKPIAILREGVDHLSDIHNKSYASASYIRENLTQNTIKEFCPQFAAEVFALAIDEGCYSEGMSALEKAVLLKLRTMTLDRIKNLPDVSEGLENRIYRAAYKATSLDGLLFEIKTKRYTMSRIRRILMYALLDFSRSEMPSNIAYVRVLGHNEKGLSIISKKTAKLPVVTSLARAKEISDAAEFFAKTEEKCSSVFALTLKNSHTERNEFSTQPIRI